MKTPLRIALISLIALPLLLGIIYLFTSPNSLLRTLGSKKIGLVSVEDVIYDSRQTCAWLKQLRKNSSVAGVVLRINSPGGAVGPSQEIYREVARYRQAQKPLVVSMGSIAASGGYYIAAPAHTIFANPGTLTGSIGVIMHLSRYDKLLGKVGVSMRVIKAGKLKDIGSPYRQMQPAEQQLLQGVLNDTHEQFIEDIATGRMISPDTVSAIADGRIFTGRQARQLGLVDSLGGLEDALEYTRQLCGLDPAAGIAEKQEKQPWLNQLLSESHLGAVMERVTPRTGLFFLFEQN
jgi:protease-4